MAKQFTPIYIYICQWVAKQQLQITSYPDIYLQAGGQAAADPVPVDWPAAGGQEEGGGEIRRPGPLSKVSVYDAEPVFVNF